MSVYRLLLTILLGVLILSVIGSPSHKDFSISSCTTLCEIVYANMTASSCSVEYFYECMELCVCKHDLKFIQFVCHM